VNTANVVQNLILVPQTAATLGRRVKSTADVQNFSSAPSEIFQGKSSRQEETRSYFSPAAKRKCVASDQEVTETDSEGKIQKNKSALSLFKGYKTLPNSPCLSRERKSRRKSFSLLQRSSNSSTSVENMRRVSNSALTARPLGIVVCDQNELPEYRTESDKQPNRNTLENFEISKSPAQANRRAGIADVTEADDSNGEEAGDKPGHCTKVRIPQILITSKQASIESADTGTGEEEEEKAEDAIRFTLFDKNQ